MKKIMTALVLAALAASAAPAAAQPSADDTKWVNACISDNKDEGQTAPVVRAYCTCMNGRMSNNETRSITQWEKANPGAAEACSRQAGWKGR